MPSLPKYWRAVAAIVVAAGFAALPAVANATLSYVRSPLTPAVFVASDARRVDSGSSPHVSPDGQTVAYLGELIRTRPLAAGLLRAGGSQPLLRVVPAAGGAPRTLMTDWREPFDLAFSPDSKTIAALRGGELGKRELVLIDVASGAQRTIASGFFSGFSFSPDGTELVVGKAASVNFPSRSDVYRVATAGGKPVPITRDHRSEDPLWGPTGKIVFVKLLGAEHRRYGPKNELYLMNSAGGQVRRLTHTKVDPLLRGLFPTDWSADGSRLLAELEGQDTSYAIAVNPRTGAQHALTKERESGFVGAALSSDGTTVLGSTGGFEPAPNHTVATVPYGGGKPTVLARNAFEPSWSR